MHNTRPLLCMQPCKQGEWGERVHLPCGSPLGFESIQSKLGCVTQNAFPFLHNLSCVHCSALDNNFITCVNIHSYEHLGGRDLKGYLIACSAHTPHARRTMHMHCIRLVRVTPGDLGLPTTLLHKS